MTATTERSTRAAGACLVWSRGEERRYQEPPLCASCADGDRRERASSAGKSKRKKADIATGATRPVVVPSGAARRTPPVAGVRGARGTSARTAGATVGEARHQPELVPHEEARDGRGNLERGIRVQHERHADTRAMHPARLTRNLGEDVGPAGTTCRQREHILLGHLRAGEAPCGSRPDAGREAAAPSCCGIGFARQGLALAERQGPGPCRSGPHDRPRAFPHVPGRYEGDTGLRTRRSSARWGTSNASSRRRCTTSGTRLVVERIDQRDERLAGRPFRLLGACRTRARAPQRA